MIFDGKADHFKVPDGDFKCDDGERVEPSLKALQLLTIKYFNGS